MASTLPSSALSLTVAACAEGTGAIEASHWRHATWLATSWRPCWKTNRSSLATAHQPRLHYYSGLEGEAKRRYDQKLLVVGGIDPYTLSKQNGRQIPTISPAFHFQTSCHTCYSREVLTPETNWDRIMVSKRTISLFLVELERCGWNTWRQLAEQFCQLG